MVLLALTGAILVCFFCGCIMVSLPQPFVSNPCRRVVSVGAVLVPIVVAPVVFTFPGKPAMPALEEDPALAGDVVGIFVGPTAALEVQSTSSKVTAVSRVLASTVSMLLLLISKCD